MEFSNNMNQQTVEMLEKIMRDHNIFAQSYEMMGEELKKQNSSKI